MSLHPLKAMMQKQEELIKALDWAAQVEAEPTLYPKDDRVKAQAIMYYYDKWRGMAHNVKTLIDLSKE